MDCPNDNPKKYNANQLIFKDFNFIILPPDPPQFLAHCKAQHKTPTQSQPCKRAKNANAQATNHG
jgi:hypothetical protein